MSKSRGFTPLSWFQLPIDKSLLRSEASEMKLCCILMQDVHGGGGVGGLHSGIEERMML